MPIRNVIRKFLYENFIVHEGDILRDDDSLLEKGVIDSTGVLELVAFIEEKYGFRVEDEELVPENLDTIQNIAEFILRKKWASRAERSDRVLHHEFLGESRRNYPQKLFLVQNEER